MQIGPSSPLGSPSPEVLEKAETSESSERKGEVHLPDWHEEVELVEIEPMLPPQPVSSVLKLRVVGPTPEALNNVKELLASGRLGGFRVDYLNERAQIWKCLDRLSSAEIQNSRQNKLST